MDYLIFLSSIKGLKAVERTFSGLKYLSLDTIAQFIKSNFMKKTALIISFIAIFMFAFQLINNDPADAFLKSLDDAQKEKTQMSFDHISRNVWHFLPGKMWPRAGIQLNELNKAQKALFFDLLKYHLSEVGYKKVLKIIDLENVLAGMGQDKDFRDPEKYFIAVYGDPSSDDLWAWSFEGHHVSVNFTISGDEVRMTPRFLGANPAVIPEGQRKGERTLASEDDMGLALINSMNAEQLEKTVFRQEPYLEIVTSNATETGPLTAVGIRMKELSTAQQSQLKGLIDVYLSCMPRALAGKRMERLRKEDFDSIRFGWAGAMEAGKGHYYRIQGKTFLVEFDNTVNNANHIHTVWRDFEGDFGQDLIRDHYKMHQH